MNTEKLCIPIYLNDKIVMDLLAIFEDGFSNVRQLKTSGNILNTNEQRLETKFGVSSFLDTLLGISLHSSKNSMTEDGKSNEFTLEKVHTNVSLFSKLRDNLVDTKLVMNLINGENISLKEGQFIEVQGQLSINPMIETLNTFVEVYEMAMRFSIDANLGNKKAMSNKKKEDEVMIKQIKLLRDDLIKSETKDLLLTSQSGYQIVLPSHINRFIETFDTDLYDGTYRVLGKVIKVVEEKSYINLFRKTSFKVFSQGMLDNFIKEFNKSIQDVANEGVALPEVNSVVDGPAAIVIPIGIYI